MQQPKQIGIAIVEYQGRYLVGLRGPDGPLPGYAEFPGGKCNLDESPFDCAVRECFEESGLAIVPERLLLQRDFVYPHGAVELYFVLCHPAVEANVNENHQGFWWDSLDQLKARTFPEANAEVIALLGPKSPS